GFVEEPVSWTLSEDRRAENPVHSSRGSHRAPALTTCPECTAVRFEGRPCGSCGWRPQAKAAPVEVAEGELGRVDRTRKVQVLAQDRVRFHGMLTWIARERGYRPGWAAHKFKEKFGSWPDSRDVVPVEPDDATRSWVRSRQIAYARAMAKQAG